VAAAADTERLLVIVRGAAGQLIGSYTGLPPNLVGLVSKEALPLLDGCSEVAVFVRPPLYGLHELLPSNLRWKYQGPPPAASASGG